MTSTAAVGIDWQVITCEQLGTNVLLRTKPDTAGPGLVAENCSKVELLGWGEIIMIGTVTTNSVKDLFSLFVNIIRSVVMKFYQGP